MSKTSKLIAVFVFTVTMPAALLAASAVARDRTGASPANISEMRAHFHQLLDRPSVPLSPHLAAQTMGPFVREQGVFYSQAGQAVPFIVMKPAHAAGSLPAVIVLHGTGGNKEEMEGVCDALAARGMLAIAIDARYHGERVPGGAHRSMDYEDAIIRAWRQKDLASQEHPFYFDTVYDLWRTVDYLQSRKDVDPKQIGIIGISMGGIEAWLAAATDERIRVVVPAIAVQSFRWTLENRQWEGRVATILRAHEIAAKDMGKKEIDSQSVQALWNKVIPGILDEFDCPNMLQAIAPRPLLILSGENDRNNPLGGAKVAFAAAEEAYKNAKAEDHLEINVATGVGHAVTSAQMQLAYDWLERWLKRAPLLAHAVHHAAQRNDRRLAN